MDAKLEQQLMDRFPFFEARSLWTGEKLGFPTGTSHCDGWYDILYKLCEKIEEDLKNYPNFKFYFSDIKEKYGTLCIYTCSIPKDSKIFDYIQDAEVLSETTCEICGTEDNVKLYTVGWWRTLCNKCNKNRR